MTGHPTDEELGSFVRHALHAERARAIDDHLATCARCRGRAATVGGAAGRLADASAQLLDESVHLSDDEVQQVAAGFLPRTERARVDRHLSQCAACAAEVADLRQWAARRRGIRPHILMAAAASILLLALTPLAVSRWSRESPADVGASLPAIQLVPAAARARVEAALARGFAEPPAALRDLAPEPESLMSADVEQPFELLAPLATVTVSDRPVFRWEPMPGAGGYTVALFDAAQRPLGAPAAVRDTSWQPAEPLPRGRSYAWQVTAHLGDRAVTVPAAPAPVARFGVMDGATAALLRRVADAEPRSHLLLGILAAEAGAVAEAEAHLRAVPAADRHADVARQTLQRLREIAPSRGSRSTARSSR